MSDTVVSGIMQQWAAAFSKLDSATLASLYSRHAFFFGSNPTLYRGTAGVTAYFDGLPRWKSPTVQFTDVASTPVGSEVINVAATANFSLDEGTAPLIVKLTWVIVREDGGWKIASHHVSAKAPLIGK